MLPSVLELKMNTLPKNYLAGTYGAIMAVSARTVNDARTILLCA